MLETNGSAIAGMKPAKPIQRSGKFPTAALTNQTAEMTINFPPSRSHAAARSRRKAVRCVNGGLVNTGQPTVKGSMISC